MAKILSKSTIVSLGVVRPWHVSQSVDAFTGIEAYDITVSGSLTVTGSFNLSGLPSSSQSNILTYDSSTGQIYYTASNALVSSTSSYAISSSQAQNAVSSSYALSASYSVTSSYSNDATSASYAVTASYSNDATSASYSTTSSYSNETISASYALTASYVSTNPLKYYSEPSAAPSTPPTSSGTDSLAIGDGAVATGQDGITIGTNAGQASSGNTVATTLIGLNAGYGSYDVSYGIIIGGYAGYQISSSNTSIIIGDGAGYSSKNSSYNAILGASAAYSMNNTSYAVLIGTNAGFNSGRSNSSIFIGNNSGYASISSSNVIGIGANAGRSITNSPDTIAIGTSAGQNTSGATSSIYLGAGAGYNADNSSYSTFIGYASAFNKNTLGNNLILIGPNTSLPSGSSAAFNIGNVLYGTGIQTGSNFSTPNDFPTLNGKVGIGIVTPTSGTLHVNGNIFATSFTGSLFGTASWAQNTITASYIATASYALSASYTVSASYAEDATSASYTVSSSYAESASYAPNFSNTDLTFTGNRSHDTSGSSFEITTDTGNYGQGWYYLSPNTHQLGYGESSMLLGISAGDRQINIKFEGSSSIYITQSLVQINRSSRDIDLNILGITDPNLFYTDASTNKIGIGTDTPSQKLDINGSASISGTLFVQTPEIPAQIEVMQRWRLTGFNTSSINIQNGNTATAFVPTIYSEQEENYEGLTIAGRIGVDTGTRPVMWFRAQSGSSYLSGLNVASRPLFKWSNYQTDLMVMNPAGDLSIGKTTPTAKLDVSGSVLITGSLTVTQGITGSLFGTASWAQNALTASFVQNAQTASYVLSSSYATTSSYSNNSTSASYALSASYAETASFAAASSDILVLALNQSGFTIPKGTVVRITGSNNASDIPRITTASYENDANSANTLGITTQQITNGSQGFIITEGILKGIDTSAFDSGQLIYLGANGSITGSAPLAPLHAVRLGEVIRQQAINGSIYVRIDNGYELEELHDVVTTTAVTGDLLIRSASVWTNLKQLTGSYGLTGSLSVTGSTLINQSLNTATRVTANTGATTIYSLATASYDGAWFEYVARSGSNARAGQIISVWSGSAVNFTETTTTDFGSTSGLAFGVFVIGANMALTASAATNGWDIKTIVRSI